MHINGLSGFQCTKIKAGIIFNNTSVIIDLFSMIKYACNIDYRKVEIS